MSAPTILRTQHKLGDYLFEPDLQKFNLPKKSSRPWIVNSSEHDKATGDKIKNVTGMEKENRSFSNVTVKSTRTEPSLTNEEIMNKKYIENTQERNANQKTENITSNINDNEKFCFPRKNFKSPKVKSKMHAKHQKNKGQPNQLYNKNVTHSESQPQDKEVSAHGAIDTQQNTEAERINRQKMELKAEQEYQNHINQMFNNPEYTDQLDQYYQSIHPLPVFHNAYPEPPVESQTLYHQPFYPEHVVQHPQMYFLPMPQTFEDPTPMTMTPDSGSDYSSEDGSCYELNVSSDTSDDEVFETNLQPTAFIQGFTGKPQTTTEPDYEIPIEMDEELNLLVLSIIDD